MKKELKYDLKKPCPDCPFTMRAELHQGVAKALPEYMANMEMDRFAHTCHKTDPRADSDEGKRFKGQPRHCAGAIAMMAQGGLTAQSHVIEAVPQKNWDMLKKSQGTFKDFKHMVFTYVKWLKAGYPDGKSGHDYQ